MASRKRPSGKTVVATQAHVPAAAATPVWVALARFDWTAWRLPIVLVLATLVAYQPAWRGGMLWDDDGHVTRAGLRSLAGLWRIWFESGATQQYYPITHSAFWLLHRVFGDATAGYHVVNILLHAASAVLVGRLLKRLEIPGAAIAATIFALHPVYVESVAWISEMKNTLSGVLYLGAALWYLRFDEDRKWSHYGVAAGLFVLALFAKSVTATLPIALLIVFWWKRGNLRLRDDVMPLVPLVVMGIVAGAITTWVERTQIGAEGAEFQFTVVERVLIAGRAVWFYLASLVWPFGFVFIYPRWQVSQGVAWQYVFPLGVIGVLAGLWMWRGRTRAPLAAALFFVVTLVPALGFVNVYPFRYSLVADHFQYLASLGIVTIISAGLAMWVGRWRAEWPQVPIAMAVMLGVPLGGLSWSQSRQYADAETLYRTTIARNPACWMARSNLAAILIKGTPAQIAEAVTEAREAVRLKPDYADAHFNLAVALEESGQVGAAVGEYRAALASNPGMGEAQIHHNLGRALQKTGRPQEAIGELMAALAKEPNSAETANDLGVLLGQLGQPAQAMEAFRRALSIAPGFADARMNLGSALMQVGRVDEALAEETEALKQVPDSPSAHYNMGVALEGRGRFDEAVAQYWDALKRDPGLIEAYHALGRTLQRAGHLEQAFTVYQEAVTRAPKSAEAQNDLGVAYGVSGKPQEALRHFEEAARLQPDSPNVQNNVGSALQQLGRLAEAVPHFEAALRLDPTYAEARVNLNKTLAMLRGK